MKQKYGNIPENRFFSTQKTALPRGGARKERAAHDALCQPRNRAETRATSRESRGGAVARVCAYEVARVGRVVRMRVSGVCAQGAQGAFPAAEPPILPEIR